MEISTARLALDLDELARVIVNRALRLEDLIDAAGLCRAAAERLRDLQRTIAESADLAQCALNELDAILEKRR